LDQTCFREPFLLHFYRHPLSSICTFDPTSKQEVHISYSFLLYLFVLYASNRMPAIFHSMVCQKLFGLSRNPFLIPYVPARHHRVDRNVAKLVGHVGKFLHSTVWKSPLWSTSSDLELGRVRHPVRVILVCSSPLPTPTLTRATGTSRLMGSTRPLLRATARSSTCHSRTMLCSRRCLSFFGLNQKINQCC